MVQRQNESYNGNDMGKYEGLIEGYVERHPEAVGR